MPGVAGLLLTGGSSRRMGVDKATLTVDGVTLAERGARLLQAACRPVLEVGPGHAPLQAVVEDPAGSGPLAAMASGGAALRERGHPGPALVMAVDLPRVSEPLLRFLATFPGDSTVVPFVGGEAQPLLARYSAAALARAGELVGPGERSMRALLTALDDLQWAGPRMWSGVAAFGDFEDADTVADARRLGLGFPGGGLVEE